MSEIRQRGPKKEDTPSWGIAVSKSAMLDFSSDAIDNSQLLLRAYLPALVLLMLYGGKAVILVTCFGGMMAYLMDLAQLKEGTITVLVLTGIGQWATILWMSADLISYSNLYLLFMAVVGIFLIHVQYVCIAHFRSYWLEFAGPFAETVERMVFASAPMVVTPLLCWAIVVQVEGAHLPSVFALVYFCFAYALFTPRQPTKAPVSKRTSRAQTTHQQPNPIITLPVLFYSYGVLALVPFVLHCSIYGGDLLRSWRNLLAACYSLAMPLLLCTFLVDHHIAYFREVDKAGVQHATWAARAIAGLATLMCSQSHPIFSDLKRLSPLGEPFNTIVVAMVFVLLFISVMVLRGMSDELLESLGVRIRAATIVRSCVFVVAAVGAVLLRLPVVQTLSAIAAASAMAEYYLSRKLLFLGVAALLAASMVFWYTQHKMWYLSHTFDWLMDVSMQAYCVLLIALHGLAILLPGVARSHYRHAITAGTIAFAVMLAAAELIVRDHSWQGALLAGDVYSDTLLVTTAILMGLAVIHLRRIKVIGDTPVWVVLAINAAKLLSVLGWSSQLIAGAVFTILAFVLPHVLFANTDADRAATPSLVTLGFSAVLMAVAALTAHLTFVPLLVSEYSSRSSGGLQALFLTVLLWSVGVLLLLVRHYPNLFRLKRLLMATILCCVFGATSPHLPFQIDPSSSTWLVWADETSDEQILQLDVMLLCGALVLLGLFNIIPLQTSVAVRIIYAVVLGVASGVYLGALLIGSSMLGFCYAVTLACTTVLIGQHAFLASSSSQRLVQLALPVLCITPFACALGGLWFEPKVYHLAEDHWSNALVGVWWLFGICASVISTCLWGGYQAATQRTGGVGARRSGLGITVAAPDSSWMLNLSSFLAAVGYASLVFAGHRSPRPRWHMDVMTLLLAFISVLFSAQKNTGRLSMAATWRSKMSQFLAGYLLFAISALAVSAMDMLFVDGMLGYLTSSPVESQTISEAYDAFGVSSQKDEDVGFWLADGLFAPATNAVWLVVSLPPAIAFLYSHYFVRPADFSALLLILPATALVFAQLTSVRLISALSVLAWAWQTYLSHKQSVDNQRLI